MEIFENLSKTKLVPVVVFNSLDEIDNTITSLIEGGVNVGEICYRTPCAGDAIKLIKEKYPNFLLGAGTIINKKQCQEAIKNGAKFIVSPGFSDEVYKVCKKTNTPYLPGVLTPTEIMHALDLGLEYLKFFPAGVFGGLKALKALSAAFPQVKFMPTGGVDNSNLKEFVSSKFIFAIGGSWLLKGDIKATCKEAIQIIKEAE
mgnify:CR=1 FL=1